MDVCNYRAILAICEQFRHIFSILMGIPTRQRVLSPFMELHTYPCRSRWSRVLRRGSAAACWLGLKVRIPLGTWMSVVSVECCQVEVSASGSPLVQRSPTECGVSECDRETSIIRRPWPTGGCCAIKYIHACFRIHVVSSCVCVCVCVCVCGSFVWRTSECDGNLLRSRKHFLYTGSAKKNVYTL